MSTPLKTAKDYGERADEAVGIMTTIDQVKANQAKEIDDVKARYSTELSGLNKTLKSLKTRLANFAKNAAKAPLIFEGKSKGTFNTNRATVSLRMNPESIQLKDKEADREHLVSEAKRMGFGNVLKTVEDFSIEAMEKLTDAELDRLGFKRVKESKTFTLKASATPTVKESQKIDAPEPDEAAA